MSLPTSLSAGRREWRHRFRDMDLEFACYLMGALLTRPERVFKLTQHHKQTKNQWARDDPAFLVLLTAFSAIAGLAYGLVAGHATLWAMFRSILMAEVLLLGGGCVLATFSWTVANRFLRAPAPPHSVEQEVEWLYAFDVHCNAFVVYFAVAFVAQFFLLPLIWHETMLALVLGNTLHLVAGVGYWYLTFQGYLALPFLERQNVFLYPAGAMFVVWILSLLLGWRLPHVFIWVLTGLS